MFFKIYTQLEKNVLVVLCDKNSNILIFNLEELDDYKKISYASMTSFFVCHLKLE